MMGFNRGSELSFYATDSLEIGFNRFEFFVLVNTSRKKVRIDDPNSTFRLVEIHPVIGATFARPKE